MRYPEYNKTLDIYNLWMPREGVTGYGIGKYRHFQNTWYLYRPEMRSLRKVSDRKLKKSPHREALLKETRAYKRYICIKKFDRDSAYGLYNQRYQWVYASCNEVQCRAWIYIPTPDDNDLMHIYYGPNAHGKLLDLMPLIAREKELSLDLLGKIAATKDFELSY